MSSNAKSRKNYDWERLIKVLELDGSPVAVAYHTEVSFEQLGTRRTVCQLIQKARKGGKFFVTKENMSCFGGGYYLGLNERVEGHDYFLVDLEKIFSSIEVAHKFFKEMPSPQRTESISFSPLEEAKEVDVVLFVCNPFQAMRIIGLDVFDSGILKTYIFGAACQTSITVPLVTGKISLSLIDVTARRLGKYRKEELIVGVPFNKLPRMMENIEKSICGTFKPEYRLKDILYWEKK